MSESTQTNKQSNKEKKKQNKDANKCKCGVQIVYECANCKLKICDDINCGTDTVNGYLCGSYTQWGCARKYTTCDSCLDDKAIHEEDLIQCNECNEGKCNKCTKENECASCGNNICDDCLEEHKCESSD
jgi:hypothetical protein